MAENNDAPIQTVQANAPIQAVEGSISEGYQPIVRKGYQPQITPAPSLPPQSISGIIPVVSTTQPTTTVTPPPAQSQSSTPPPTTTQKTP